MKQFLKTFAFHLISLFLVIGIFVAYAINYPSTPPAGETAGGKFAAIFNNILQSGNYATDTTGKVKLATLSDNATSVSWTGVTGKPTIISAEVDPKVGTLTAGKWCKVVSGKIECTENAPTTSTLPL